MAKKAIRYINDSYNDRLTEFYKNHNVTLPQVDKEYTIRQVVLIKDQYCLLLNEIKNEGVILNGSFAGEPPFHYSRFTDGGEGSVLDWETINEIYKNQNKA